MNPCRWHQRVYFVTSRGKSALEDYFDIAQERTLRKRASSICGGAVRNAGKWCDRLLRQHKALGLGHAVWCARRLVANDRSR
jgi:UTP--glucose-1-phosphate uridylyltransferase